MNFISRKMVFGYGQFIVRDKSIWNTAFLWTEDHMKQGFARIESVASFSTMLNYGEADLRVFLTGYKHNASYERVIAVPFLSVSGEIFVEGPEEAALTEPHRIMPGAYRLVSAQRVISEDVQDFVQGYEAIDVFFEKTMELGLTSAVVLADAQLSPPDQLLEFAEVIEN